MSIFITGAGPNITQGIANKFKNEVYQVALGNRSINSEQTQAAGSLPIRMDASSVKIIQQAFAEVTEAFSGPLNVVIYNANSVAELPSSPTDVFAITTDTFIADAKVNTVGAYAAAKGAVTGLGMIKEKRIPKVYINTGNVLPFKPLPVGTTLGTVKAV